MRSIALTALLDTPARALTASNGGLDGDARMTAPRSAGQRRVHLLLRRGQRGAGRSAGRGRSTLTCVRTVAGRGASTTTRSERNTASRMSWVTSSTVQP